MVFIKSLTKGVGFGAGFIGGIYLISLIPLDFLQNPIKEMCKSIAEMLLRMSA